MFYSAQTGGFYDRAIHTNIPADAVEITREEWRALFDGLAHGKQIVADKNGKPVLQDPPTPAPVVPAKVTMRQARLALLAAGYLDRVQDAFANVPDEQVKKAAMIEWEYAGTVERDSPFTTQMAAMLGLSSTDLDTLFTTAAAL